MVVFMHPQHHQKNFIGVCAVNYAANIILNTITANVINAAPQLNTKKAQK